MLIIEDDEACVFILQHFRCFKKLGFEITKVVSNGKEALEAIEEERYDLILADISMPIINGVEFAEIIRSKKDHTRIIFMSTYQDFDYAKKAIKVGALDYLIKPVKENELSKLLAEVGLELQKQWGQEDYLKAEAIHSLYEALLSDTNAVLNIIKKLKEITSEWVEDEEKKGILKQILEMIWLMLCQDFKWIRGFKNFKFEFIGEDIWIQVDFYLNQIEEVVRIFSLNKLDVTLNHICLVAVEHIDKKNIFDRVAEEVQLNKDYIGKLFKRKVKVTFNQYLTFIKMEYAKSLIINTNLRVYEISERLGYESTDYFTKLFKAGVGMTPIKFKEKCKS